MKSILLTLCLAIFTMGLAQAQNGLENIVVETFYISDAADAAFPAPDNVILGSTTYRVYVDMAAGYELVSIYGQTDVANNKIDALKIESTQPFFNNEDRGDLFGYNIGTGRLDEGTVMIDSYFSTGRTSGGTAGVLKDEDTDGAIANGDNVLQNADPLAGTAISVKDGNIPTSSTVTFTPTPGFDAVLDASFGSDNQGGMGINTSDAALGLTVSLVGPTADNRVLIGQFTTHGVFTFALNLQIRNIATGVVEEWVAETPQADQFSMSSLTYGPNDPPTVSITAPAAGANYTAGNTVAVTATAADTDGTIAQVEFFFNGTSLGVDADGTDGYTASFIASASGNITAVATDNGGESTTSAPVNIVVAGNDAPTVSISAPLTAVTGDPVALSATANDTDGTIAQVEFFVDNVSVGVDADGTDGYNANWTAVVGAHVLKATATDNMGATGSASQNISVTNNQAPSVALTSHVNNEFVAEGPVTLTASASDNDGTIAQVEFFVDGVSVGIDNDGTDGYSAVWNAVFVSGTTVNVVTVVATDDRALTGNSAPINLRVSNPAGAPYLVETVTQFCNDATVCMPIATATGVTIADIIGFDIVINFDNSEIYPTGQIFNSSDLVDADLFETDYNIDFANQKMLISVFFKANAPIGTAFSGMGDIICVEFAKRPAFDPSDASTIEIASIQESYPNGVVTYDTNIQSGDFISVPDTLFPSSLVFWLDNSPMSYDAVNPMDYLITNISGTDANCDNVSLTAVQPDLNGEFTHNLNNGLSIQIDRDIAASTDVLPVINGFDALQVRKLLIDQLNGPSVYQILAMDVNLDGVISAGDASQMNQRAVLILDEFRQAWNYNADGTQGPNYGPSKDWVFVDQNRLNTESAYMISSTFPDDNGTGYSKYRVPTLPFCLPTPVTDFTTCPEIDSEIYKGILLGDINGNYATIANDGVLRSDEMVIVNLEEAKELDNQFIEIPVYFESAEEVNTIDLALTFAKEELRYHSVRTTNSDLQVLGHYNIDDNTLRVTSNSLEILNQDSQVFLIKFEVLTGEIASDNFRASAGYINGDAVAVDFVEQTVGVKEVDAFNLKVYPNPTNGLMTLEIAENANVEIVDIHGRKVFSMNNVIAHSTNLLDLSNLVGGVYMLNVFNDTSVSTHRVVISK